MKYNQQMREYVRNKIIENNGLKLNNFGKRYKSFAELAVPEEEKKEKRSIQKETSL